MNMFGFLRWLVALPVRVRPRPRMGLTSPTGRPFGAFRFSPFLTRSGPVPDSERGIAFDVSPEGRTSVAVTGRDQSGKFHVEVFGQGDYPRD